MNFTCFKSKLRRGAFQRMQFEKTMQSIGMSIECRTFLMKYVLNYSVLAAPALKQATLEKCPPEIATIRWPTFSKRKAKEAALRRGKKLRWHSVVFWGLLRTFH